MIRIYQLLISARDRLCSPARFRRGTEDPNPIKERNGFPPNFIHSLDSTHMMLTSLHMRAGAGRTFASIHDCYWTHAEAVDDMNTVCRRQFVALHSQPVLESLVRDMCARLDAKEEEEEEEGKMLAVEAAKARRLFKDVPEKGQLDLERVKESVFFFS